MYEIVRLPSGQYGVCAENGKRLGVYRTKQAATRRKQNLERKSAERLRKHNR